MNCRKCGAAIENGAVFCAVCGAKSEEDIQGDMQAQTADNAVYCEKCGMEIFSDDTFCPSCGSPVIGNGPSFGAGMNSGTYGAAPQQQQQQYSGGGANNSFGGGLNTGSFSNQPMQQRNNNSVIIAIVIAAAMVIVAAGGAVFYMYMHDRQQDNKNKTEATEIVATQEPKAEQNGSVPQVQQQPQQPQRPPESSSRGYLYDTDRKYITESDLAYYSRSEVRLILNEMYARHGYIFSTQEYKDYFERQPWYYGTTTSQAVAQAAFNSYEDANYNTIVNYETKMGWR